MNTVPVVSVAHGQRSVFGAVVSGVSIAHARLWRAAGGSAPTRAHRAAEDVSEAAAAEAVDEEVDGAVDDDE